MSYNWINLTVYNFKKFKRSLEDLEKNIFNFKIFNQEEESIAINI